MASIVNYCGFSDHLLNMDLVDRSGRCAWLADAIEEVETWVEEKRDRLHRCRLTFAKDAKYVRNFFFLYEDADRYYKRPDLQTMHERIVELLEDIDNNTKIISAWHRELADCNMLLEHNSPDHSMWDCDSDTSIWWSSGGETCYHLDSTLTPLSRSDPLYIAINAPDWVRGGNGD